MGGYDEELVTIELPAIIKLVLVNQDTYSIQSLFDIAGQKLRQRQIKKVGMSSPQQPPCITIELE